MLNNKKILLCISGSIAAYKSAYIVRLLIKSEAQVKVVMTEAATTFITPLTLSTLSNNPVYTQFQDVETGEWNNHVELGLWADAVVVAPATAKTLSSMAHGYCDNLVLACYLSAKCPVFFAPAMDLDMFKHQSTQGNIFFINDGTQSHASSRVFEVYVDLGATHTARSNSSDAIRLDISPNPTTGNVIVQAWVEEAGEYEIIVNDIQGKVLLRTNSRMAAGARNVEELRLDSLSSGVYFITLRNGNLQQTKRLELTH